MRTVLAPLVTALLLLGTGCASVASQSSYPVTFNSQPSGAEIAVRDRDGNTLYRGPTPATIVLHSSDGYFRPARYAVEATLPGHHDTHASLRAGFDPWYIGNFPFGGMIGFLGVDPLTGAMWKLDRHFLITLGKVAADAPQQPPREPTAADQATPSDADAEAEADAEADVDGGAEEPAQPDDSNGAN